MDTNDQASSHSIVSLPTFFLLPALCEEDLDTSGSHRFEVERPRYQSPGLSRPKESFPKVIGQLNAKSLRESWGEWDV